MQPDNFCFPIPEVLENEKVKLVPFILSEHAQQIIEGVDTDTWVYLPFGPYDTTEDFIHHLWEARVHPSEQATLFVVFDKLTPNPVTGELTMAGIVGYINSSPTDLCTEIAFVVVFPSFRRTHVASNMVGLLLHYALDLPEAGGLGLRRVQWMANVKNSGSVGLAMKMGLKTEGILRWARVLPPEKAVGSNGLEGRKGDPRSGCTGRDSILLAICWDDWESGGREQVDNVMNRTK